MLDPRKPPTSSLQKEETSMVTVKPRGGVQILPHGGNGGGVTNASSGPGHMVGFRPTSNLSTRRMLKPAHSSVACREPLQQRPHSTVELPLKPNTRQQRDNLSISGAICGNEETTTVWDETTTNRNAKPVTKR